MFARCLLPKKYLKNGGTKPPGPSTVQLLNGGGQPFGSELGVRQGLEGTATRSFCRSPPAASKSSEMGGTFTDKKNNMPKNGITKTENVHVGKIPKKYEMADSSARLWCAGLKFLQCASKKMS